MNQENTISFDRDRWWRALEDIALALGKEGEPVEICLIGSAVCIFGGMLERASRDLDVWKPNSSYDRSELQRCVESVGLAFNPMGEIEPTEAYLQIVEPGIVQVGEFQSVLIDRIGRLRITRPPIENIVAAKLSRASGKDIDDISFLIKKFAVNPDSVRKVISSFSEPAKTNAQENLIYLEVLS